eukprot:Selendium_serpulae@DN5315_c0_g1_i1.p1
MMETPPVYTVVFTGNKEKGGYTVYVADVCDGERVWSIAKRYRELRELHDQMKLRYPHKLTWFPGKRFFFGNKSQKFIEERQHELQKYMDTLMAVDPECKERRLRAFLAIPGRDAALTPNKVEPEKEDNEAAKRTVYTDAEQHFLVLAPQNHPRIDLHEQTRKSKDYRMYLAERPIGKTDAEGLTDVQRSVVALLDNSTSGFTPWTIDSRQPQRLMGVDCAENVASVRDCARNLSHAIAFDRRIEGTENLRVAIRINAPPVVGQAVVMD